MNIKEDVFKKTYLESFLIKENSEKMTSPDPEVEPDTGNPIDDLTKENTTTIDEDSEDKAESPEEKEQKNLKISIQAEGIDDIDENEFEDDGWGDAISEKLNYLMDELENFTYEIRNCSRGAYTNCKTKEQLKNYMANDLVDMITTASEEI